MNHLFISYSRKEEAVVDAFADLLRAEKIPVWQDKSGAGTGIPFSTKWFDIIREAIFMAGGALIFRSKNWEASRPCGKEWEILKSCGIPVLILIPEEVTEDPEAHVEKVREFIAASVDTSYNNCRTSLCNAAYEYHEGMNIYQLVKHTRGISGAWNYITGDIQEYKEVMEREDYENKNPEYYEDMKGFLRKARNVKLRSMAVMALGALLAVLAFILAVSIARAVPEGIKGGEKIYTGLGFSRTLGEFKEADPLTAMGKAVEFSKESLSETAYTLLGMNALELMDIKLPERVLTGASDGEEKKRLLEGKGCSSSEYFRAEPDPGNGSLRITDLSDGSTRTVNVPGAVSAFSWNEEGTKLVYSAGNRIFVYDPSGIGNPIQLSECYEQIREVRFVREDSGEKAVAVTERDSVLIWDDPIPDKEICRTGIRYGIFTHDSVPTAVFIDGDGIVVNRGQQETVFTLFPDWKMTENYFAVSEDGKRAAVILNRDEEYGVGVVDLADGSVICELTAPCRPTSLCFASDNRIYASAFGCGIMWIDAESKEIAQGAEQLYYGNIIPWKDDLILTDYTGICSLFGRDLKRIKDLGNMNDIWLPYADIAVAENRGYLFSVNRGGGGIFGCARFTLANGAIHRLTIQSMDRVASNTAVAVSGDEHYVAYGYPNGVVRVYETEHLYLAYEKTIACESVIAVDFSSDDSELLVLGESGNIYTDAFRPYSESLSFEIMQSNWEMMQADLEKKRNAYYDAVEN